MSEILPTDSWLAVGLGGGGGVGLGRKELLSTKTVKKKLRKRTNVNLKYLLFESISL